MPELKIGLAYVSALNFDPSFLQFNGKKKIIAKKSSRFEFKCWRILKTASLLYEPCLPLTLTGVKLNVRPEMSTEPTNFLTLMNNGKAFSSLDGIWHVATSALTSFSFYQDTGKPRYGISWDLKKPS